MPKTYRKKTKKVRGKRSRINKVHLPAITRWPFIQGITPGMPPVRRANLRIAYAFNLTSTGGALASQAHSANDLFDPTTTVGTRKPMGFNNWADLYRDYVVVGSKIIVRPVHVSGASSYNPAIAGIILAETTTMPYNDYQGNLESRKGPTQIMRTNSGYVVKDLTCKFSAKKFFNISDIKDNQERIGATTSATPTDQAFFIVWYQTLNASTQESTFVVECDYIVEFSQPKAGEVSP